MCILSSRATPTHSFTDATLTSRVFHKTLMKFPLVEIGC